MAQLMPILRGKLGCGYLRAAWPFIWRLSFDHIICYRCLDGPASPVAGSIFNHFSMAFWC